MLILERQGLHTSTNFLARKLLHNGLAKSSRNAYVTGQRRYVKFCKMVGAKLIPTSESILILFVTYLATSNISLQTEKVYLAAVRHNHVCKGLHKHFSQQITPRLHLILRGIQKRLSSKHFTKPWLPIALPILRSIKKALSKIPLLMITLPSGQCAALPSSVF